MEKLNGFFRTTSRVISMVGFLFVVALVTVNVLLRTIFNAPILGVYEMAALAVTLFGSAALATATMLDGHIAVDLLTSHLRGKIRYACGLFVQFVDLFYWALIAYCVGLYAYARLLTWEVTDVMKLPVAVFRVWMVYCILIVMFVRIHKMTQLKAKLEKSESRVEQEQREVMEELKSSGQATEIRKSADDSKEGRNDASDAK